MRLWAGEAGDCLSEAQAENVEQQKARLSFLKRASLNMAPLTGIALASNWLINKLNLNSLSVKTTIMTTQ